MERELVKKAFLEVLDREVDEDALEFYSEKDLNYRKLCNILRCSKEYISKFREELGGKREVVHNNSFVGWPFPQLFVAKNLSVLYCPVAKNACSSIKSLIVELSDIPERFKEMVKAGDVHLVTDNNNTGIQLKDLNESDANKALFSDDYFRFVVLRDPASRLVSAYWEKFVVNRLDEGNLINTLTLVRDIYEKNYGAQPDPDRGVSFKQFVEYIEATPVDELDPHWRHQYKYSQGIEVSCYYDQSNLSPLYQKLREISGVKIEEKKRNISNSGKGSYVEGGEEMLPSLLLKHKGVSRDSFLPGYLINEIESCFSEDYELMERCVR